MRTKRLKSKNLIIFIFKKKKKKNPNNLTILSPTNVFKSNNAITTPSTRTINKTKPNYVYLFIYIMYVVIYLFIIYEV